MDDKELQLLFEAKRTTEANRRRQEQLAATIARLAAGETAPHPRRTRRLWPATAAATAAAVALLVVAMPALRHRHEAPAAPQLARVQAPAPQEQYDLAPAPTVSSPTKAPASTRKAGISGTASATGTASTPRDTAAAPVPDDPMPETREALAPEPDIAPAPPAPVRRRSSTLLACTEGCTPPQGQSDAPPRAIHIIFGEGTADQALAYTSPLSFALKDTPTINTER